MALLRHLSANSTHRYVGAVQAKREKALARRACPTLKSVGLVPPGTKCLNCGDSDEDAEGTPAPLEPDVPPRQELQKVEFYA